MLGERLRRVRVYIALYAVFFIANVSVSVLLPGLGVLMYLNMASIMMISLFLYGGAVFQRVFAGSLLFAYSFMTEVLATVLLSWITGYIYTEAPSQTVMFFSAAFLAKLLLLAAVFIVARQKRERFLPMPVSHQAVLLLTVGVCAFLSIADMVAVTKSGKPTTLLNVLTEAGITMVAVAAFYVYGAFQRYMHREIYSAMLERQTEQSRIYFRRIDEVQRDARAVRHDFTNHMMSLNQMLRSGDYVSLEEYTQKYIGELSGIISETITGVASADGLISVKKQTATNKGISLEARAGGVVKIAVNPIHLNIILGNALDNAIEACLGLPAEKERRIELDIKADDEHLTIRVANSSPPVIIEADGLPRTTKDGSDHGVGLGTVRRLIEKYDGRMLLESGAGEFIFSAYMKNKRI
jgi:signal transduction histidine kinase